MPKYPKPQWLDEPFRAQILTFSTRSRTTDIVKDHKPIWALWLGDRPPLVLPLADLLSSPRKVKLACVRCWYQVPNLPNRETWRRVCNRWLPAAVDRRIPYGEGRHRVSMQKLVAGVIDVLHETGKAGGGA